MPAVPALPDGGRAVGDGEQPRGIVLGQEQLVGEFELTEARQHVRRNRPLAGYYSDTD